MALRLIESSRVPSGSTFDDIVVEPEPVILGIDLTALGIELVVYRVDKREWFRIVLTGEQLQAVNRHTAVITV